MGGGWGGGADGGTFQLFYIKIKKESAAGGGWGGLGVGVREHLSYVLSLGRTNLPFLPIPIFLILLACARGRKILRERV